MRTIPAIEIFQKAAEFGLSLGFEPPDTLKFHPANCCPLEFAFMLRAHKAQLLALLRLPFVMVYSQTLEETIFFCEDEDTKAALVQAGADCWSIYTKDELRVLVAQNRIAPLTQAELAKLYEIKRTFRGTITEP